MTQLTHIFILMVLCSAAQAESYLSAGASYREGSMQVSAGHEWPVKAGYVGLDISFVDCGKQPAPHDNINRFLSLSFVARMPLTDDLSLVAQSGLNSSRFSHNGENAFYNDGLKSGYNAGIGVKYLIAENVSLYSLVTVYQYMQANKPLYGGYTTVFGGLRYDWGE